jgi:sulfur-carrier protein adenylyltransferase/sulfurtransferase
MGSHGVKSISVGELERRLEGEAPPFLLDVREPEELADGAIASSVSIPMGEVQQRLSELPTDRDIVVICHLGARSAYITRMLEGLGYDRVVNLSGGMEAWLSLGPRGPHHGGD